MKIPVLSSMRCKQDRVDSRERLSINSKPAPTLRRHFAIAFAAAALGLSLAAVSVSKAQLADANSTEQNIYFPISLHSGAGQADLNSPVADEIINRPAPLPKADDDAYALVTYQTDDDNFLNPERGFHDNYDITKTDGWQWVRTEGYTLNSAGINLGIYRTQENLPTEFLANLRQSLDVARTERIKLVVRVLYNDPRTDEGDDYNAVVDAPLNVALAHIRTLGPIFTEYQDIIAAIEAGFVGAWGEWHGESSLLVPHKQQILDALLLHFPRDRSILLRYPGDIIDRFPQPLNQSLAYNTTDQARIGHHNDCFLATETDAGTYRPPERKAEFQNYLGSLTQWTPMGGETCEVNAGAQRASCDNARKEMARFHWSYIADKFHQPTLDRWDAEGCRAEIEKRLGYRYRLIDATAPQLIPAGSTLKLTLRMTNDGFAGIFNKRDKMLILRNRDTYAEYRFAISAQDTRRWLPQPDVVKTLDVAVNLPSDMPQGQYDLYLALPDPSPNLATIPEYSIRLANRLNGSSIWEAWSGYNALGLALKVEAPTAAPTPTFTPTSIPTKTPTPTPTAPPTSTPVPQTQIHFELSDSLTTLSGSIGNGQVWANIHVPNQSGSDNDWPNFVKFISGEQPYSGYRSYILPDYVAPNAATSIQVQVNYRGPGVERQRWTWRLYDWSTNSWVTIGDNSPAPWWGEWTMLYFNVRDNAPTYIHPQSREIRVQLEADNTVDSMDMDYEGVVVKYK